VSARFVAATPDVVSLTEGQALLQNVGVFTFSYWVVLNSLAATQQIFYLSVNGGPNSRCENQIPASGAIQTFARGPDSVQPTPASVTSTGTLSVGVQAMVTVVVDIVNDLVYTYINGVLDSASPQAMVFTNAATDNTVLGIDNGFGGNEGGSQPCNADVWDLCFWHRALTAGEIATMFHGKGAILPAGCVGRMRCNEGAEGVAIAATALRDTSESRLLGDSIALNSGAPTFRNDGSIDSALRRAG
jgi:hypothetical protein